MPASTLSPLIEYILAAERPGGGKLAQLGALQVTTPILPPAYSIVYEITPLYDAFANIWFSFRIGEQAVPEAFTYSAYHPDYDMTLGALYPDDVNNTSTFWMEVTKQKPLTTVWTNVSGLNQFQNVIEVFLIVKSEENLAVIREIVRLWNQPIPVSMLNDALKRYLRPEGIASAPVGAFGGRR